MNDDANPTDICVNIVWMSHLIDRLTNLRLPADRFPAGMSFARANLLFAIHAAGQNQSSARMVDIALDLGVTARTLTTMVDALERQGLISRQPDPADRRAIQLVMQPAGATLLPELAHHIDLATEAVVGPLSTSERATLLGLLQKLIERG